MWKEFQVLRTQRWLKTVILSATGDEQFLVRIQQILSFRRQSRFRHRALRSLQGTSTYLVFAYICTKLEIYLCFRYLRHLNNCSSTRPRSLFGYTAIDLKLQERDYTWSHLGCSSVGKCKFYEERSINQKTSIEEHWLLYASVS